MSFLSCQGGNGGTESGTEEEVIQRQKRMEGMSDQIAVLKCEQSGERKEREGMTIAPPPHLVYRYHHE